MNDCLNGVCLRRKSGDRVHLPDLQINAGPLLDFKQSIWQPVPTDFMEDHKCKSHD